MKSNVTFFSICFAVLAGTAAVYGCSDDGNNTSPGSDAGTGSETSTDNDAGAGDGSTGTPAPPALGAQIDRFGRPAINTATSKTFTADDTRDPAEDAYNADSDPSGWVTKYKGDVAQSLAILDSLDTNCGNQIFADNAAGADRYGTLASVLADDRQWLDTSQTACTQYLGVELKATGVAPDLADCGGRALGYDVIDVTYSAVAIGKATGVTDGVDKVAAKTDGTTFPYLAKP